MAAEFTGSRAANWTPGQSEGNELFRLMSGANNLVFEDLSVENFGNGVFRAGADISNLTIRDVDAVNVSRFIEDYVSGTATSASINGLTVQDVTVTGYSKGAIRLQYDTRNVVIENVVGDSQHQNGGLYISGIALDGTVHDVLISHTTMKNAYGNGAAGEYWNGDGFSTERNVYNVRFEDTVASGNTDAGYDLKSSNTTLLRAVSDGNNRNYRFWSQSITLEDSVSIDPTHSGGNSSSVHVWLAANADVTVDGLTFSDALAADDLVRPDPGRRDPAPCRYRHPAALSGARPGAQRVDRRDHRHQRGADRLRHVGRNNRGECDGRRLGRFLERFRSRCRRHSQLRAGRRRQQPVRDRRQRHPGQERRGARFRGPAIPQPHHPGHRSERPRLPARR